MDELYPLFFENLQDNISSVRQGAALALANVVRAYGELFEDFQIHIFMLNSDLTVSLTCIINLFSVRDKVRLRTCLIIRYILSQFIFSRPPVPPIVSKLHNMLCLYCRS